MQEYAYKLIHVYVNASGKLFIIPTGRSIRYCGAIKEIDMVYQVEPSYSATELVSTVKDALDKCYSLNPDEDQTGRSPLEKLLNVRGYNKATKGLKLILFEWILNEGYKIVPTSKIKKEGYLFQNTNIRGLGTELKTEVVFEALKEASNLSVTY